MLAKMIPIICPVDPLLDDLSELRLTCPLDPPTAARVRRGHPRSTVALEVVPALASTPPVAAAMGALQQHTMMAVETAIRKDGRHLTPTGIVLSASQNMKS